MREGNGDIIMPKSAEPTSRGFADSHAVLLEPPSHDHSPLLVSKLDIVSRLINMLFTDNCSAEFPLARRTLKICHLTPSMSLLNRLSN